MARVLVAASAGILFALGFAHLVVTFYGPKLRPRDAALQRDMERVSPVITSEISMWQAWMGFNASHSFGAMLFGAMYGYLAWEQGTLLFGSSFLIAVGALMLLGYVVVGRLYWFSVPFRGIVLSAICYAVGMLMAQVAPTWI